MILGIVGSIASGKDTIADYLKTKGWKAVSISDILRQIMLDEGEEITTVNMTEFGNKLRETKGHGYLAKRALEEIKPGENAIITSIRQVGEIEVLKENPDFHLVKLDAPIEMRLERLVKRGRAGDIKNMTELSDIEAKQADGKGGAINMNKCYEMADEEIVNDGTFEELYQKIDQLIFQLKAQKSKP